MLGVKLTLLMAMGVMGGSPLRRLRVATRQLQWNGDSNEKVVPQCKAGYNDVSGGSAFYWSCAFHCEGGPYYATEGCICACLTPEQETAWRGMVTTLPASPFSPADEAARRPGEILVTPPPATTRRPFDPVSEIPVGEIDGESPSGSGSSSSGGSPSSGSALPPGFSLATPTAAPKAQVIHNKALDMNVVVIAVIAACGIAGVTLIFVICFNCRSMASIFRKNEQVEKPKFAMAPVLRLHADPGASNSPCCDVEAPSSRASSKMSTNSGTSGPFPNSRRSSKASTGSYQPQKDTSSLLKLPRTDGLDVAGTSVESLSSWAREHLLIWATTSRGGFAENCEKVVDNETCILGEGTCHLDWPGELVIPEKRQMMCPSVALTADRFVMKSDSTISTKSTIKIHARTMTFNKCVLTSDSTFLREKDHSACEGIQVMNTELIVQHKLVMKCQDGTVNVTGKSALQAGSNMSLRATFAWVWATG